MYDLETINKIRKMEAERILRALDLGKKMVDGRDPDFYALWGDHEAVLPPDIVSAKVELSLYKIFGNKKYSLEDVLERMINLCNFRAQLYHRSPKIEELIPGLEANEYVVEVEGDESTGKNKKENGEKE